MWKVLNIEILLLYCCYKFALSSQNECPSTSQFEVVNASSRTPITSGNLLWEIDCKVKDYTLLRATVSLEKASTGGECMWYVHLKDKKVVKLGVKLTEVDDVNKNLTKQNSQQDDKDRFESIDSVNGSKVSLQFQLGQSYNFSNENQNGFNVSFKCSWLESTCNISSNTIKCIELRKGIPDSNQDNAIYFVIPIIVVIVLLLYLLFAKRRNKFPFSSANGSSAHTEANNLVYVQSTPETKANPIYTSTELNEDAGETINPIYESSGPDERQNQIYRNLDGDIDGRHDATYSVIDDKKKHTDEENTCDPDDTTYAVVDKRNKKKKAER